YAGYEFKMGKWRNTGAVDDFGNDWICSSTYVDLHRLGSDAPLQNNIAYYVYGREDGSRRLKLVLNINDPPGKANALAEFERHADRIASRAVGAGLSNELKKE